MTSPEYSIRDGFSADIPAIERLVLEQGPNEWNHLPEDDVRYHVGQIAFGSVLAVVAAREDSLIGVITYEVGHRYPHYQPSGRQDNEHGYVAEAVVHREYAGNGIGTELLQAAVGRLVGQGIKEVYAMRHADNVPSGRMMDKSGLMVIAEFDDPDIRPTGSRRTAVTRFMT